MEAEVRKAVAEVHLEVANKEDDADAKSVRCWRIPDAALPSHAQCAERLAMLFDAGDISQDLHSQLSFRLEMLKRYFPPGALHEDDVERVHHLSLRPAPAAAEMSEAPASASEQAWAELPRTDSHQSGCGSKEAGQQPCRLAIEQADGALALAILISGQEQVGDASGHVINDKDGSQHPYEEGSLQGGTSTW